MPDRAEQQEMVRLRPRRLGHGNIFVSDLPRAMRFYEQVCGIEEVFQEPGIFAGFHSNGSSHHDIGLMRIAQQPRVGRGGHVQIPTGRGMVPGLNHLGFEMESEADLVAAWQRGTAAGLDFHRVTDHGISHSLYLFDPEGNLLEFYADTIPDWREFFASKENQLISGQWEPDPKAALKEGLYVKQFDPSQVEGAAIHPRRVARAVLEVADLPKMIRFYTEVAGLDLAAGGPDTGYAVLKGGVGEYTIGLVASGHSGLHHLGFEVSDEAALDKARAALDARGVSVVTEIDHAAKRSFVIADPDGLKLEFYVPRSGSLPDAASLAPAQRSYLI